MRGVGASNTPILFAYLGFFESHFLHRGFRVCFFLQARTGQGQEFTVVNAALSDGVDTNDFFAFAIYGKLRF